MDWQSGRTLAQADQASTRQQRPVNRKYWTRAEINRVVQLVNEGLLCPGCIGRMLGRSQASVRSMCDREDISLWHYLKGCDDGQEV